MSPGILLALVVGTLIPAVTSVITKYTATNGLKALVSAGLAAITGVVATVLTTPPKGTSQWEELIGSMLVCWIASTGAYVAAWKPSHAAAKINAATGTFGLGHAQEFEDD